MVDERRFAIGSYEAALVEPLRGLHRNDLADVIEEKLDDLEKYLAALSKSNWRALAKRIDDKLFGGRCRRAYRIARGSLG